MPIFCILFCLLIERGDEMISSVLQKYIPSKPYVEYLKDTVCITN